MVFPLWLFSTTGCYCGVPCSLKLLSLVLKLSYFSPSFMLLPFCVLFPTYPTSSPFKHILLQSQSLVLPVDISLLTFFRFAVGFLFSLARAASLPLFFFQVCAPVSYTNFLYPVLDYDLLESYFTLKVVKGNGSMGSLSAAVVQIHI